MKREILALIPEFELGLWNAWIFMGPSLLFMLLCLLVMTKKDAPGGPARIPCKSKTTLLVASLSKIIYFPAAIYSVFLLLQLGTTWFYVGELYNCLLEIRIVSSPWIDEPSRELGIRHGYDGS